MKKSKKSKNLSMIIKNMGGIKNFSVKDLEPGSYMVEGENASGKTSFIEAFLALCDIKDIHKRLVYKSKTLGSVHIIYNEKEYMFPFSQNENLLTYNKYIESIAFCNSTNEILTAMLNGKDNNNIFLKKKLTEIVGYDTYNKIDNILVSMIETYWIQIQRYKEEISEFNLDATNSNIVKTKKEIKEYKNLAEEYSYITDLVKEKEKEIDQLKDYITSLDEIQESIKNGNVFTYQEEYIRKNIGLLNLKTEAARIRSKLSQFEEHVKEYQQKSDIYSKQLDSLEKKLQKSNIKKEEYLAERDSIEQEISESQDVSIKYTELLTSDMCPYCRRETESHRDRFKQKVNVLVSKILSLGESLRINDEKLEKVSKLYETQRIMLAEHLGEMNRNASSLQDLESFKQSNEIQLQDTEKLINKLFTIEDKILSESLERREDMVAAEKSLNEIRGPQYEQFLETMRESEAASARLKQLERNKKNIIAKKSGIKSLTDAGIKLRELKEKVDETITKKIRETENQIEESLNGIITELQWDMQKINFKDGKITVIRNHIEFPIHRLSKAESSSIVLLTLYHIRKLVAPEFPFFFLDDIGYFDPEREEKFIKFINKDINEGEGIDFMFFTRPKSDVPLQVVKYE